jgi:hypothetical protein
MSLTDHEGVLMTRVACSGRPGLSMSLSSACWADFMIVDSRHLYLPRGHATAAGGWRAAFLHRSQLL